MTDNRIEGNLQCKEDRPAPTGGGRFGVAPFLPMVVGALALLLVLALLGLARRRP